MEELLEWFPVFLLVLVRMSAFVITLPLFSYQNVPAPYKIGFSFFLAWIVFFTYEWPALAIDGFFFTLIIKEALIGLTVGFTAAILLYAIQVAGGFIDIKMGFMIANVIDPQTGAQSPLTGGYLYTFALLFLLATDAHHLLLDGVFYSYQFVPVDQAFIPLGDERVIMSIVTAVSTMFIIAFQMAVPVVGALFLIDVALGMVSRTVPQVNVFVVGLPLKIFAGLVMLFLVMAPFFVVVSHLIETVQLTMRQLLELYGGIT
ncbi:flagellar biosynthetic protein FliR [Alteribacter lacisalsi]|uniref:Flagellar biosynthetic protein FliR n=1 Tax=Alteribacter lacisalsi TaxID=2045244 RepID=A0A2W0HAX4_9BACI|nr:flagellar biosynthetic protein FliR [Alteribacter lacisalsi]PYZ98031.1 flagellar biosynthetic protein FliR [Alteribacter lacisalsi]